MENEMTDIAATGTQSDAEKLGVAGFWRRAIAFWIDCLILAIVGWVVILIFFDFLVRIGEWSRLIGFVIGSAYFIALEGGAGRDQSFGKHLMKIKVVRCVDGEMADLNGLQAWLRYVVIAVPCVLGGISFIDIPWLHTQDAQWLGIANNFAMFCWGMVLLYLLIFNLPSRQSLHDLATSSMVVRVEANTLKTQPIKRIHWIVPCCVLIALLPLSFAISHFVAAKMPPEIYTLQRETAAIPGVAQSNVMIGTTRKIGTSESQKVTTITVFAQDPELLSEAGLTRVAKVAFASVPSLSKQDVVSMVGVTYVNLGIATWSNRYFINLSPSQWAQKIASDHS
jgi:uncharacterized RDD family membrane protein YckC